MQHRLSLAIWKTRAEPHSLKWVTVLYVQVVRLKSDSRGVRSRFTERKQVIAEGQPRFRTDFW